MVRVLLAIVSLAITIYALADCARTPGESLPAKLPKALWLLVILLLTPLGGLAWIVISRIAQAESGNGRLEPTLWSSSESVLGSARPSQPASPLAPDDDPEFLWHINKEIERKRRLAQQSQSSEPVGSAPRPQDDPIDPTSPEAGDGLAEDSCGGAEGPPKPDSRGDDDDFDATDDPPAFAR